MKKLMRRLGCWFRVWPCSSPVAEVVVANGTLAPTLRARESEARAGSPR